jgi:hypothetical protein
MVGISRGQCHPNSPAPVRKSADSQHLIVTEIDGRSLIAFRIDSDIAEQECLRESVTVKVAADTLTDQAMSSFATDHPFRIHRLYIFLCPYRSSNACTFLADADYLVAPTDFTSQPMQPLT